MHLPPFPGITGVNSPPGAMADGVPRLLFQTWKSKSHLPINYMRWRASLLAHNSDFTYVLWDDADNRRFIAEKYPWFLPVYNRYPREIYRVDAVRYFFLYHFGGVYVDLDTECLKPLKPLLNSGDVLLGRMGRNTAFHHSIPNAIMASRPLQEFWLLVINLLMQKADAVRNPAEIIARGPEAMTGPILLKEACDIYLSDERTRVCSMIAEVASRLSPELQPAAETARVVLLQSDHWYPLDWTNAIHFRLCSEVVYSNLLLTRRTTQWLFPDSYLVTYWTHSWKPKKPDPEKI